MFDFGIVDDVRRHDVNRVADRAQQGFAGEGRAVERARKPGIVGFYIKGGDHAALAQVAHARMLGQRCQCSGDFLRARPVLRQHVVLREDVERSQRGAAGERVAGVRVRMQEGACGGVVVKGFIYRVRRHDDGQRQVAARDAF